MPGLSASELPQETLHAGDQIEYFSRGFVCGDPRGHRTALVLRVDNTEGVEYPISVDTGEMVPLDNIMRLLTDRHGNAFDAETTKWRKLRSYRLVAGSSSAPMRASTLSRVLPSILRGALASAQRQARFAVEEIVGESSQSEEDGNSLQEEAQLPDELLEDDLTSWRSEEDTPETANVNDGDYASNITDFDKVEASHDPQVVGEEWSRPSANAKARRETIRNACPGEINCALNSSEEKNPVPSCKSVVEIIDLVSSDDGEPDVEVLSQASAYAEMRTSMATPVELPQQSKPNARGDGEGFARTPTDAQLLKIANYISTVPSRYARRKIRHLPKKRPSQWHVPRSRKRKDLAKCAITSSGNQIYHARSVKAKKLKTLLKLPGIRKRLQALRERGPEFVAPTTGSTEEHQPLLQDVPWPAGVEQIKECDTNGVSFPDLGEYHSCKCIGDCYWDTCDNIGSAVYCTPDCCRLQASCSNAPRSRASLQLFDTQRVGLGVFTTTPLRVGDVVGEYAGRLSEYPALVEGQPAKAVKENSGYTLLYNAKSVNKNYVYVEALECGSITRFISHACRPNATFIELQNRTSVKVLVKMIEDVGAGAQITVHYGDERWFTCACDDCWTEPASDEELDGK